MPSRRDEERDGVGGRGQGKRRSGSEWVAGKEGRVELEKREQGYFTNVALF